MTSFFQDLRLGLRGFNRQPGFSLVIVCILAVGIGSSSAVVLASTLLISLSTSVLFGRRR